MRLLHHLLFDPLSAWEQFKYSLAVMAVLFPGWVLWVLLLQRRKR